MTNGTNFHRFTRFQSEINARVYATDITNGVSCEKRKTHIPGELDPDPSSSDSLSHKSNSPKDSNYSKSSKKKAIRRKSVINTKKRTRQNHHRSILIRPTTVTTYAKQQKKKSHQKTNLIKLCALLTAKLLTTAYKSNIIRFKLDEDLIQRRIYLLAFVESLEMIYSQYR